MISKESRKMFPGALPSLCLLMWVLLSLAVYSSAPKAALGQKKDSAKSSSTKPAPDPCDLLSSSEIKKLQGESVVEKKYSEQGGSSFLLRTCFYRTVTFNESISLALAVPNPGSAEDDGPREYWMEHFRAAGASPDGQPADQRSPKTSEEQEERGSKPVKVSGLGEQAYWIADPHVGTLYVLEDNYFLRISLGGKNGNQVRSKKANDLARAALKRLKHARRLSLS